VSAGRETTQPISLSPFAGLLNLNPGLSGVGPWNATAEDNSSEGEDTTTTGFTPPDVAAHAKFPGIDRLTADDRPALAGGPGRSKAARLKTARREVAPPQPTRGGGGPGLYNKDSASTDLI